MIRYLKHDYVNLFFNMKNSIVFVDSQLTHLYYYPHSDI